MTKGYFVKKENDKEATEKTRKQIQEQEMMKEKIRQNKSNDKSSVIKLMRKIIG